MATDDIIFHDGHRMPRFGFGVWQVAPAETRNVVRGALAAGFRLVDTAAGYGNEREVGEALRDGPTPRDEVFVTTKLRSSEHGYDQALRSFDTSMTQLGLETLDLYLIHWPVASQGLFVDTWRAFARLRGEGRVRSIGVSNFTPANLRTILDETGVVPVLNQIELHPRFQQRELRQFAEPMGIVTQAWSPLGRGSLPDLPVIQALAAKYRRSWAQVVLAWHLAKGISVVTRSSNPDRIRENMAAAALRLDPEDIAAIDALDSPDGRVGRHPDAVTG
jgi:2,5-diketo-D-gluconate reductase A